MRETVTLMLLLCLCSSLFADEHAVSVAIKTTLTTNTRFLYNIDKPDTYVSNKYISLNVGFGGDVRWNVLWHSFYLGASVEVVRSVEQFKLRELNNLGLRIPAE